MNKKSTPNLFSEMFMSLLKSFTIILVIIVVLNNVIWVYSMSKHTPHVGDTHVEITQNGNRDIEQSIN